MAGFGEAALEATRKFLKNNKVIEGHENTANANTTIRHLLAWVLPSSHMGNSVLQAVACCIAAVAAA